MEASCYQDVILCTFAVLLGFMVIVHTRSAVGQVNVTPSFFSQSLRSRGEGGGWVEGFWLFYVLSVFHPRDYCL